MKDPQQITIGNNGRFLTNCVVFFCFFFFAVLGMETRASHMLGKHSTTKLHPYLLNCTY
jgi:hypothetical protein